MRSFSSRRRSSACRSCPRRGARPRCCARAGSDRPAPKRRAPARATAPPRPLEAALFDHAAGRQVRHPASGIERVEIGHAEQMIDHRPHRFGGVAAAPIGLADPVADLGLIVVAAAVAAGADQGAAFGLGGDGEGPAAFLLGERLDPGPCVVDAVGMRDQRRHLGDFAIIRETGDYFCVIESRRAQKQPLGLEHGRARASRGNTASHL